MSGYAAVYISTSSFKILNTDLTGYFKSGVRVEANCVDDGVFIGTVDTSSFNVDTTIVLTELTGNLTANLKSVKGGVGVGSVGSLPNHDHRLDNGYGGLLDISEFLTEGPNIDFTYDAVTGTMEISGGRPGSTDEEIQDIIGTTVIGGNNIVTTYDDIAGTLEVSAAHGFSEEQVQDIIGTTVIGGNNIVTTYDDEAGTLEVSGSHTSEEEVQDIIGTTVIGGNNIVTTYDDNAGTLEVSGAHTPSFNSIEAGDSNITVTDVTSGGNISMVVDGVEVSTIKKKYFDVNIISRHTFNLVIPSAEPARPENGSIWIV